MPMEHPKHWLKCDWATKIYREMYLSYFQIILKQCFFVCVWNVFEIDQNMAVIIETWRKCIQLFCTHINVYELVCKVILKQ